MSEFKNMPCEAEAKVPSLSKEQLKEFSKIAINFLKQHLTEEEISAVEIEVRFTPISKEPLIQSRETERFEARPLEIERGLNNAAATYKCQPGPPIDGICAARGGYWGLPGLPPG